MEEDRLEIDSSDRQVVSCTFTVHYRLSPSQALVLTGNHPALGRWILRRAPTAHDVENGYKEVTVDLPYGTLVNYKWVVVGKDREAVRWMEGEPSILRVPRIYGGYCKILSPWGGQPRFVEDLDPDLQKFCEHGARVKHFIGLSCRLSTNEKSGYYGNSRTTDSQGRELSVSQVVSIRKGERRSFNDASDTEESESEHEEKMIILAMPPVSEPLFVRGIYQEYSGGVASGPSEERILASRQVLASADPFEERILESRQVLASAGPFEERVLESQQVWASARPFEEKALESQQVWASAGPFEERVLESRQVLASVGPFEEKALESRQVLASVGPFEERVLESQQVWASAGPFENRILENQQVWTYLNILTESLQIQTLSILKYKTADLYSRLAKVPRPVKVIVTIGAVSLIIICLTGSWTIILETTKACYHQMVSQLNNYVERLAAWWNPPPPPLSVCDHFFFCFRKFSTLWEPEPPPKSVFDRVYETVMGFCKRCSIPKQS